MFGFDSLAPARLYAGSEQKTTKPATTKSKLAMGDVQSVIAADGHATTKPNGNDATHRGKEVAPSEAIVTKPVHEDERPSREHRDSGVGSFNGSHEAPYIEHEPEHTFHPGPDAGVTVAATGSREQHASSHAEQQEPSPTSHAQAAEDVVENRTASIDFTNPPPAEAGPSLPRSESSHSSLQRDAPLAFATPARPDETHFNAIAYRRDPETVIAYLVPLPQPNLPGTGTTTAPPPPKYFLYAPPAPHLVKPRPGINEGYARKLTRHWQQNVRRATRNAHNGRRVSARGVHSKLVRGATWALDKLEYDDVTFLARIHPKTVTHLILIHPWGLAAGEGGGAAQTSTATLTPEAVMRTFRAQMFASKKRAKRNSILSAVFFMPALVIDTAAIFFGGMAEVDGIWMLVSVTAYRTARFITRKMGPEPKTMELEQAQLIEDAKRSGFPPPPEPEEEEDSEPGAVRRSVDALRRSLGSVKYRMSMNQRRSRSKKRKGGESSSTDTSRPQTTEASRTDIAGFSGGELEHHAEEEHEGSAATGVQAAAPPSTAHSGSELSGYLEHMDEVAEDGQPESSRGVLGGDSDGHRASAETSSSSKSKKKGQNFQLTFYPSPAMEVLARYVQESCHMKNGRVFSSPTSVPTEEDFLAVIGWHAERREHDTPEEQADDEQWQAREIKDDLRQASRKAAKEWNKSCRKQAKQQRRSKKGGLIVFRRHAKSPKGKSKETSASGEPQQAEKKARAVSVKDRIAAVRSKAQRKHQTPAAAAAANTQDESATASAAKTKKDKRGRAAGAAAILCVPCFAIAEHVKHRQTSQPQEPQAPSEKGARRGALKQRLSSKRDALAASRQRKKSAAEGGADTQGPSQPAAPVGLETPTDIDEPPTDTDGQITAVGTDVEDQTDVEDNHTAQQSKRKSAMGRLLAIPAAIAAAIGAVLKKRRDGKEKSPTAVSEGKEKKPSRFSALQERFKARRTRVSKKKPASTEKRRTSGLKNWFQELKQERKAKSAAQTKEAPKASHEDQPKSATERGAMAGLVAGCFVLPVTKVKQVRDKRRKTNATTADASPVVAGTPLSPVVEEQQQQPPPTRAATSGSSTLAHPTAAMDRPSTSYQAPVVEEEYDDPPEELPNASQYLPGYGQSEVPVRPGPPDATLGSSSTAVEQTTAAAATEPQQSRQQTRAQTAGEKLKAVRAGVVGFANRRRATGEEAGDEKVEEKKKNEPARGESAPVGRFQGIKDGLEGFKAKRRTADSTQADAVVAKEKTKPAANGDDAAAGGRFQSLKDGLANMTAKKTGTEPPAPTEKIDKEKSPGFVERMRWVWLVA